MNTSMDISGRVQRLFDCIGEINDLFIEEEAVISPAKRNRAVRYGTFAAAAASVGLAVTYWYIKSKKSA